MATDESALPHSGPQDFLIRSEEHLRIATERVAAGRARLEKFVVTETKTVTVEVSREEIRLVHLGVDESSDASVPSDDAGRWLVLSREEVVVTKKVVPVERVRLEIVPVVEQRQVTESVRSEKVAIDLPTTPASDRH